MTSTQGQAAASLLPPYTAVDLCIDGRWRKAAGSATFETVHPASGQVLAEVASASVEDVDEAVHAAREQLNGEWGATPGVIRGKILHAIADLIERDGDKLARLEALDIGKPIGQPSMLDVPNAAATFRHFAGRLTRSPGKRFQQPAISASPRTPTPCENRSA